MTDRGLATLTTVADYLSIPALEPYALEESWVLGVVVSPGVVELEVDLCFSASNPELRPPRDGEYAYFRRGFIRFTGVASVRWDGMGHARSCSNIIPTVSRSLPTPDRRSAPWWFAPTAAMTH